uniref:F-box domain-containing protein n=1 Tax=Kalmanozyma brasiliensis (strain GHG001) TaxID=1365824 RepID=V5EVQ5_KALBG
MSSTDMNGDNAAGLGGGDNGSHTTLQEQISCLSLHTPAGTILAQLGKTDADYSSLLPQPSLPPEVLERVVRHLQQGVVIGDPIAHRTLIRISGVSRLMRHWAFEALYSVIILPRHVREFRKWYSRSVKAQPASQFAGYTQALFSSLDDVSALTSFSAGWDHELLRLLHYCGPTLTHLSLWRAESMALLRDPGQVREGYRFGTSQPVQMWGEMGDADVDAGDETIDDANDAAHPAPPEAAHADDLFSKEELDDMPGWLKAEIRLQGTRAVTIRHKAHLTPTRRITRRQQGCQPTHLSIMMSLPLLEHEDLKPALVKV